MGASRSPTNSIQNVIPAFFFRYLLFTSQFKLEIIHPSFMGTDNNCCAGKTCAHTPCTACAFLSLACPETTVAALGYRRLLVKQVCPTTYSLTLIHGTDSSTITPRLRTTLRKGQGGDRYYTRLCSMPGRMMHPNHQQVAK